MESFNNGIMKKVGIYKMYWDNNDYYYYGQSINLKSRFSGHLYDMKKNKHKNIKIQSIYNKYGAPKFDICEICLPEELNDRENIYLKEHYGKDFCCNLIQDSYSCKGRIYTEQGRMAIIAASKNKDCKGSKNPFYGMKHSEETKILMSEARKGKKYPKLSEAKKGTIVREETKQLLSKIKKYGGSWKARIVLDTNTGVFYSCAKEVSDLYGINYGTLMARLCETRPLKNNTQFIYT